MYLQGLRMSAVCALLGLTTALPVTAQDNSDNILEEIMVTATRREEQLSRIPVSITSVDRQDIQQGTQQLGLDESLSKVPGLFMQNRYNFAQDLRVSIRGAGSRANFGIRGIKIYIDGIPSTTTDGQGGVDDIDLGSAERVEVIRGPASALYGSASGGVISIFTEDGPETPFIEGKATFGQYDMKKYQLKTGGQYKKLNYLVNFSQLDMDGYRENSQVEHTMVNSKFRYDIDPVSDLTLIFNAVDSPVANDPGSLTAAQVAADRTQAPQGNLDYKSGESVKQQRLGAIYHRDIGDNQSITVHNFYVWRDFITFLPFQDAGVSAFDRFFFGGGAKYEYSGNILGFSNNLIVGFDADAQRDDRTRYDNLLGVKGPLSQDQLEKAESYGFYFRDEFGITDNIQLSVGGRYDILDMAIEDHYLADADQSASVDFHRFSPTVGLTWSPLDTMSVYASYGTAFETPTFVELSDPGSALGESGISLGGFANVKAQTADSYEIGVRGRLWDRVNYDLTAYTMQVSDEVVNTGTLGSRGVFDVADTDRNGVEALITVDLAEYLKLTTSYTYMDFQFDEFPSNPALEGKRLPLNPQQQFYAELAYRHPSGLFIVADVQWVDEYYANNANTAANPAYTVANLRFGRQFEVHNLLVTPYMGVNNFTDEKYNGNVRPNFFGGRYYEPAPPRNVYGGLTVRYNF